MIKLILILLVATLPAHVPTTARAGQDLAISSVVEKATQAKEPDWQLAKKQSVSNDPRDGVSNTDFEDNVTMTWKRKGQDVTASVYKFKELERARNLFSIGTITPIMRRGYKLTKEGEELKKLVNCSVEFFNCAAFLTNRSSNGSVESYDAVLIMGRVVIIVRARKPDIVQRFALHIAQAIRAT